MKHRLFVAGVAALALSTSHCMSDYSEGSRAGVIQKLSYKGMVCKTWEGEMLMGGMVDGGKSGSQPNIFEFTVPPDANLLAKAKAAFAAGKPVTIDYKQWAVAPFCSTDSGYIVQNITP